MSITITYQAKNHVTSPNAQSVASRLATLPPAVQSVFTNPKNGTPDNISNAGCLMLARQGKDNWNAWRREFPVTGTNPQFKNFADFSHSDFRKFPVDFSEFEFGKAADFSYAQWGDSDQFQKARWGDHANFQNAQWGNTANFQSCQWGHEANFEQAQWGNLANFQGAMWGTNSIFKDAKWGYEANFINATWGHGASFHRALWDYEANFQGACWGNRTYFNGARWEMQACFKDARWGSNAEFQSAQLSHLTDFRDTHWGDKVDFHGAQFGVKTTFQGSHWQGITTFEGAKWEICEQIYQDENRYKVAKKWAEERGLAPDNFQSISFAGAYFVGEVNFSNRKFTGQTDFGCTALDKQEQRKWWQKLAKWCKKNLLREDDSETEPRRYVLFNKPPKFHGCELHQDTTFDGAVFPPASGSDEAARAYRTLKLAFNKQQALREEQHFFKLEMLEEEKQAGATSVLYWLYGFFCDYGFSLWRPVAAYLLLLIIFAYVYGSYSQGAEAMTYCISPLPDCQVQWHWLDLSFAQSLPLTGFDKLKSFETLKEKIPATLLAAHKLLTLACLFFAGLALRNLFRLK